MINDLLSIQSAIFCIIIFSSRLIVSKSKILINYLSKLNRLKMSPGTSSEDVLLMVNHVHHKKNDGTLYLMNERIAWMPDGKDTFTISHKYADIKMQKISPDGKSKVQLQVVLHNGDTTTFHFVNPMGTNMQLQDRNGVKELLQQLLPKFKRKINKELEEKNNILANDPILFQLYRDLVATQVITADEFWANYVKKPSQKTNNDQEIGVSGSFLIGIAPQTDGSCGIKYNITPEIIDSIFRTYPAVKRKHMENVPHKITESEFWTKFFQSHYFHRDRLNINSKDLFSECAKNDDQDIKSAIDKGIPNPFVDVSSFEEDNLVDDASKVVVSVQNTQKEINQSMIRRFNHYSMMVLQSCSKKKSDTVLDGMPATKKPAVVNNCVPPNRKVNSIPIITDSKKSIIENKTKYEDLSRDTQQHTSSLNLSKIGRYLSGPTPMTDADNISPEEVIMSVNYLNASIHSWNPNLPSVLAPSSAIVALGELMPGGSLMKNMDGTQLKDSVPVEIQTEMKQLYCALAELLRHFWCCFPTTTPQLEEKVISMQGSLQRFEYAKLQPFQEKLVRNCLPQHLCEHMRSLLQAAYKKYSIWQSKLNR